MNLNLTQRIFKTLNIVKGLYISKKQSNNV